jgi:hypothetical protein
MDAVTLLERVELWSAVSCGGIVGGFRDDLVKRGFFLVERYLISEDSYRSRRGRLGRWRLRIEVYLIYPVWIAAMFLFRRNARTAIVTSTPFFGPALAVYCASRKVRIITWWLDIYPEALVQSRMIKPDGSIFDVLRSISRFAFRESVANVFLGPRLLNYTSESLNVIATTSVIEIGANRRRFLSEVRMQSGSTMEVLYAGNCGNLHDTGTVIAALEIGLPANLRLIFRGKGSGLLRITAAGRREVAEGNLVIGGGMSEAEWMLQLESVPIALVSLSSGAERVMIPSKTYSALMAGQAVIAICEKASDLADLILKADAGWVIKPGDGLGLNRILNALALGELPVAEKRENARRFALANFDGEITADRWSRLIRGLTPVAGCT